eukprot:gene26244-17343_t
MVTDLPPSGTTFRAAVVGSRDVRFVEDATVTQTSAQTIAPLTFPKRYVACAPSFYRVGGEDMLDPEEQNDSDANETATANVLAPAPV